MSLNSLPQVICILGFLMLLLQPTSTRSFWKQTLNQGATGEPHDSPRADYCPPPPQFLPPGACQAKRCEGDAKCPPLHRCCYNGCAYTCLEMMRPPPVLDWLVQPKPRWLGGNGWLLDGPEEALPAETCSTTEDGEEPLLCPSGYECHILSPGDASQGIPNRGHCVKRQKQHGFMDRRVTRGQGHSTYPRGHSWQPSETTKPGNS